MSIIKKSFITLIVFTYFTQTVAQYFWRWLPIVFRVRVKNLMFQPHIYVYYVYIYIESTRQSYP